MENYNNTLVLGTEKIGKLLLQYAVPSIIAMTAVSLYHITDSIFIGRGVGPVALNGLAITFPMMNLSAAFGTLVGIGASTLLSIRIGQRDYESANVILGNTLVLSVISGLIFSVPSLIFLKPILVFFGASPDMLPYAHEFMSILLFGNIVTNTYFGLNALIRSSGNPNKAMIATVLTVIINLMLNPFFIFVLHLGIRGSALATIIAQTVVLVWQFHLFNNKKSFIRWKNGIYRLKVKIVKDTISIGLAPFLMNAAGCFVVIIINRQLLLYEDDDAAGAYGIINRIAFLFVMVVLGLNQALQPIVGYNFGAGMWRRVIEALKKTIFFATVIMTMGFIVVELFTYEVAAIFTDKAKQIDLSVDGLRWVFGMFPLVGFQIVCSAFFQSIGKANKAIILAMTRQVLFLIPLLLILPNLWGITGVWTSMMFSDFISVILAFILLTREIKAQVKIIK